MLALVQWHRNEHAFIKCQDVECDHYSTCPPRATRVFKFLRELRYDVVFSHAK